VAQYLEEASVTGIHVYSVLFLSNQMWRVSRKKKFYS